MAKIIYILGAGASAKALPVVNEFRLFIGYFLEFLISLGNVEESIIREIRELHEDMKYYPSPDTLARKLELSKEKNKLKRLNNLIGLMFLWKEDVNFFGFRSRVDRKDFSSEEKYNSVVEKSEISIDPRYIAFFSALIESSENKILDKNLGIISWNYDSQIEKTLSLLGAPLPKQNQYIKLNGSASISDGRQKLGGDEHDIRKFTNNINGIDCDISYAWDNKEEKIELVGHIIRDTLKVIIIGYSFPIYNRYMDNALFTLLSGYNEDKILNIEIVGASEGRLLEYENSVRSMLELGNWVEAGKEPPAGIIIDLGEPKRLFTIKKLLSSGQFPIPPDLPIFGKRTPVPNI